MVQVQHHASSRLWMTNGAGGGLMLGAGGGCRIG